MEIKQQKGNKLNPPIPLPLIVHPHTKKIKQFTGIFNGFCVEVKDPVEMRILTSNGSLEEAAYPVAIHITTTKTLVLYVKDNLKIVKKSTN